MPRHPDFQKIYDAFMWRYCQDHKECDIGKNYYYGWLKNMGLDDTKPYQQPQESFSWIEPYIKYLKEDEFAKYFKVEALFPLTSMNNNVYTADELLQATRTLIGKPVNWDHTAELATAVSIFDAQYEGDCAECLLKVLKGSRDLEMIEKGNVVHVSIECDCLRGSEWTPEGSTCNGLVFTGLALLRKNMLPGVPLTRIMPVEKLVESFTVTDVTKMSEQNNSNPPTNLPPSKSLQEMTLVEIAAEIERLSKEIFDLDAEIRNLAPEEQGPLSAKRTVLYAQVDGYRQALTAKILAQATSEAQWTTAYINELPDSSFAVIEPAYPDKSQDKQCRHLPYKDKSGTVDLPHLRNGLARMDQIQPVTDSISADELRAKAKNVLIAAAKTAGVGDYAVQNKLDEIDVRLKGFEGRLNEIQKTNTTNTEALEQLKKPKEDPPKQEPKKEPCKCVLTKEGFWARFHQLRQEGASKSEAFRLVSLEVIEAASKKSKS